MINLPIKIVDLVTLLFLSLLVVIIIFIILQRNIKRFKLRNVKDPHFFLCKSIPKELKDAILKKHTIAHTYNEPEVLLTSNYVSSSDERKTFLTRMKAFETSKNLEYALAEFGYRRPATMKFEEFIDTLISNFDDVLLPKDLLSQFSQFYLWAMLDPMKFDNEALRKLNRLINRIIDKLASSKKPLYEIIIQHRLDLNENGDYDFNKPSLFANSSNKTNTIKSKSVKFEPANSSQNINANNNSSAPVYTATLDSPFESAHHSHSRSFKLKEHAAKLAKSVFSTKKSSKNDSTASSSLLGGKRPYEEMKNTSMESGGGDSTSSPPTGEPPVARPSMPVTTTPMTVSNPWSTINDDSIKPDEDDLENEKIPLVVRAPKHASGVTESTAITSTSGKHQKNKSSVGGEKSSTKRKDVAEAKAGEAKTSARDNETYDAN